VPQVDDSDRTELRDAVFPMPRALLQLIPSLICASAATAVVVGLGLVAGALAHAALAVALIWSVCAAQWYMVHRDRMDQIVARRYLELLTHLQEPGLAPVFNAESLPAVDHRSPWYSPLTRIRDFLASFHDRQMQLETARTALDIRLQRTLTQLELNAAVLSKVGEPVLAVDAYDELLLANSAAEMLLETHGEKRRIAGGAMRDKLTNMIADVRRRPVAAHRTEELEWTDAAGHKRWYRATVDNLRDQPSGFEHGGAVVVLRDVSAAREIQQQHAEFVSAASHEMKTPLAGIKAYVELLADGEAESETEREEFLDVITGQADRLQRLIENLLNIARIEAGVVQVSKSSRGVNEIAAEALEVLRPAAEAKQITLVSDLSPLYLGAMVDRDMLSQAIINLLSNAVKYTPHGGTVTLRSRLADQEIQIDVEDTGVGLSEEDCVRVFEKFYRVEKDKNMAAGTGLGLALAQHIVEDVHGGRLTVRSKLGQGSTFGITIPSAGRNA
jgi:two-component system phosphate regulon sensor histidine kinase PhoR